MEDRYKLGYLLANVKARSGHIMHHLSHNDFDEATAEIEKLQETYLEFRQVYESSNPPG